MDTNDSKPLWELVQATRYDGSSLDEKNDPRASHAVSEAIRSTTHAKLSKFTLKQMKRREEKNMRATKARLKARKKLHYTQKRKYQRDWDRENRLEVRKDRRFDRMFSPEGSYEGLVESRTKMGVEIRITLEEWRDIFREGDLEGRRVKVLAYDPEGGTIDRFSIYIQDLDTKQIAYDGKEAYLKQEGYIY